MKKHCNFLKSGKREIFVTDIVSDDSEFSLFRRVRFAWFCFKKLCPAVFQLDKHRDLIIIGIVLLSLPPPGCIMGLS